MFDIFEFLKWLGWADWANKFLVNELGTDWTFSDLVFGTVPAVLQLFFVIWLLNWIMGFIFDVSHAGRGGGMF